MLPCQCRPLRGASPLPPVGPRSGRHRTVVDHPLLPGFVLIGLQPLGQRVLVIFGRLHLVQHLGIGPCQEFLQVGELFFVYFWLRLLSQVLHTPLERESRLARLFLLQGLLAKVVEELDVQQHQQVANFLYPMLALGGLQDIFLGSPDDLGVQSLEQEAHILGLDLGLDRAWRVVHRDSLALCDQTFQFGDACLELAIVLVQGQLPLVEAQFQTGQQQLEGRGHELAGEGLGDFATAAHTVGKLDFQPRAFQFAVLDHVVEVADHDQQGNTRNDEQCDQKWGHR